MNTIEEDRIQAVKTDRHIRYSGVSIGMHNVRTEYLVIGDEYRLDSDGFIVIELHNAVAANKRREE
jgi:hypothetical protein